MPSSPPVRLVGDGRTASPFAADACTQGDHNGERRPAISDRCRPRRARPQVSIATDAGHRRVTVGAGCAVGRRCRDRVRRLPAHLGSLRRPPRPLAAGAAHRHRRSGRAPDRPGPPSRCFAIAGGGGTAGRRTTQDAPLWRRNPSRLGPACPFDAPDCRHRLGCVAGSRRPARRNLGTTRSRRGIVTSTQSAEPTQGNPRPRWGEPTGRMQRLCPCQTPVPRTLPEALGATTSIAAFQESRSGPMQTIRPSVSERKSMPSAAIRPSQAGGLSRVYSPNFSPVDAEAAHKTPPMRPS